MSISHRREGEKNALNFLVIHTVLMNQHKLAQILWKRSEDPILVRM
jgi:hypothetical protein